MKRVRILRDGAIGDPGNARAGVVHTKKDEVIELSDAAADMCVNVSDPPRAEYVVEEPASGDAQKVTVDAASLSSDSLSGEPESDDGDERSFLDRLTGKGKDESSILE